MRDAAASAAPPVFLPASTAMTSFTDHIRAVCHALVATVAGAADQPGVGIYKEHCGRCHGETGGGTTDLPDPLVGDLSVNQLAAYIDETMPEDDPSKVTGEAARRVAEYIYGAFYSPVARDRNRPARVELTRLTVRQYQNTVADLIASFRGRGPGTDDRRGLKGEYFHGRDFGRHTTRTVPHLSHEHWYRNWEGVRPGTFWCSTPSG
jgi:hypothetical protein